MEPVTSVTFDIASRCLRVMYVSRCISERVRMRRVSTIPNPEYTAPATKYGGNKVACHPGRIDTAKSMLTIECTEITSGVASAARIVLSVSYRDHVRCDPFHPRLTIPYNVFLMPAPARSRSVAKSGIIPTYQNTSEIVR